VTHVGSDNKFEVSSVLEMMTALVKKYAQQLLPFSSHINGILDYLEGFTIDNLHKVGIYLCNLLGMTIYCI
jgi:Fanconi anemia group D2 protein